MFAICQDYYFIVGGVFYKNVGFYLEGVWLWRISGRLVECLWLCEELVGVTWSVSDSVKN